MNRIANYLVTLKWWAGFLGAGITGMAVYFNAPPWLIPVGALLTAVALWELPYQEAVPVVVE